MKLTLAKTWKECIGMWKWVDHQIEAGSKQDVQDLKRRWVADNGYRYKIRNDCFFCESNKIAGNLGYPHCKDCPGVLVSKRFNCHSESYHYYSRPRKFYQKLLKLDKKRKSVKKRRTK